MHACMPSQVFLLPLFTLIADIFLHKIPLRFNI